MLFLKLNFVGTTSGQGEPLLFFHSSKFEMEPVECGLVDYPVQVYELYNGGDTPAHVEIDCSSLRTLNAQNYSSPIVTCLSSESVIVAPGTCYETKWLFAPIESKTYQADVLFKTNKLTYNVVTFKCIGYDKRKLANAAIFDHKLEIPNKQIFFLPNQVRYMKKKIKWTYRM